MRKNIILIALTLLVAISAKAQGSGDLMINGGLDLLKSDNNGFGNEVQLGVEANYFFNSELTASAGFENWTSGTTSIVLGTRYYIKDDIFARVRALFGENDISIGGGYSHSLNKHWRIEAMGDIYLEGDFALRGGVAYMFGKVN
jgi:hypothetical protein